MMSCHQLGTSVYFVDLGWNFRLDLKGISGSGASCLTFESNERSQKIQDVYVLLSLALMKGQLLVVRNKAPRGATAHGHMGPKTHGFKNICLLQTVL